MIRRRSGRGRNGAVNLRMSELAVSRVSASFHARHCAGAATHRAACTRPPRRSATARMLRRAARHAAAQPTCKGCAYSARGAVRGLQTRTESPAKVSPGTCPSLSGSSMAPGGRPQRDFCVSGSSLKPRVLKPVHSIAATRAPKPPVAMTEAAWAHEAERLRARLGAPTPSSTAALLSLRARPRAQRSTRLQAQRIAGLRAPTRRPRSTRALPPLPLGPPPHLLQAAACRRCQAC